MERHRVRRSEKGMGAWGGSAGTDDLMDDGGGF